MEDVNADKDYAAEILPAETEYTRLVESTDAIFSHFVNRLREPDLGAGTWFHKLMEKCLDIGVVRNRLVGSTYALLVPTGDAIAIAQEQAAWKLKDGSRRHVVREDLSVESFEPYFQLSPVIDWKSAGNKLSARSTARR